MRGAKPAEDALFYGFSAYGIRIFPVCCAYCIRPYIVGRVGCVISRTILGAMCGIESGARLHAP